MKQSRARQLGVMVWVCALSLLSISRASRAEPAAPPAKLELPATPTNSGVVIFPARTPGAHPLTVLLHGMCGDAARACSHFADEVTREAHLVCPRASVRCAGGGASWPERGTDEAVEAAVARAKIALGDSVDDSRGRTLIGYSMGAFRALGIVQSSAAVVEGTRGRYSRVMLIGAKIALDPRKLEQNGVERLLLCAGSWDMMHDHMQRESERALRAGFSARFLDLGPVGHAFTPGFGEYLPQALTWLNAREGAGS